MNVFQATVQQMAVLFGYFALGFFLGKRKILPSDAAQTLSKLEVTVLVPALCFCTFYRYCTVENVMIKGEYILYGTLFTALSVLLGFLLTRQTVKDSYRRRVYAYAVAIANYGFVGNAVVLGVFGTERLFDYMMFTMPLSVYVYSFGMASLIPQQCGWKDTVKGLLNPVCLSMVLGGVAALLAVPLPAVTMTALDSLGNAMSPISMLLTGLVIAEYSLKELLCEKRTYGISAVRLILLPLLFFGICKAVGLSADVTGIVLCAAAMPIGLNTVVVPAAYGEDTKTGASFSLISQLLSTVTVPLLFLWLL